MIPYAEFERAVSRWKIRQSGGHVAASTDEVSSGAVVSEVAAPNAEVSYDAHDERTVVSSYSAPDEERTPSPDEVTRQFSLPTDGE